MPAEIVHFGAVTLRVNGVGNLIQTLIGVDEVESTSILDLSMAVAPGRLPTRLTNYNGQEAVLRLQTTEINEYVRIQRIIVWVKPVATSFPM